MILDRFVESVFMHPFWQGDTVYHEDVLFYKGRKSARLLYPISEIISVRSYDLKTEYKAGRDFLVENGELILIEGGNIPVLDVEPFTSAPQRHIFPVRDSELFLTETCGIKMRNTALAVTYRHTDLWEDGYSGAGVVSLKSKLPSLFKKLENGEEVNILIYGDSMSTAWGSSGGYSVDRFFDATNSGTCYETGINVPPYTPAWCDMFVSALSKKYPLATINLDNLSLGGKGSLWGADNISARLSLAKHKPDLVLIGFGINDSCGGVSAAEYKRNTAQIIKNIKSDANGNENAYFVPFSCHSCNEFAECYPPERFALYEDALCELENEFENTAAIRLYSLFADMARCKEPLDRLENNINHTMDMGGRVYAQAVLSSFC